MSKFQSVLAASLFAAALAVSSAVPALAQDDIPPATDEPADVQIEMATGPVITNATSSTSPGDPSLNGPTESNGTQSTWPEVGFGWWQAILPPWRFYGIGAVHTTGNPTAKAWVTVSLNGYVLGTSNPCLTTTSCTSIFTQNGGIPANNGDTALAFAQTTTWWTAGGSVDMNATLTKTF